MPAKNSLINIFMSKLPASITKPICREYDWRKTEIQQVWNRGYERYQVLEPFESTIDALLALSIFYRHIVVNLDGASDFYVKINRGLDKKMPIQIGKFEFNEKERRRLLAVHIQFGKIIDRYQIKPQFFEYADTLDFLRNCLVLYNTPEQDGENDSI